MTRLRRRWRSTAGMTLIELCIVILVLGFLLTFAVVMFQRARQAGNESSAIASLRAINSAQFAYHSGCGGGGYATSLPILASKPPSGAQGYLAEELGGALNPLKNGYRFTLAMGNGASPAQPDCFGRATVTSYYASAVPESLGQTGGRSFATNQRGTVYQANGGAPPAEPFDADTPQAQ